MLGNVLYGGQPTTHPLFFFFSIQKNIGDTTTKMKKLNKKGMAEGTTRLIVGVGIGVIVISVIAIMLGAFQADLVDNSVGCNAVNRTNCPIEYNVTNQGLTFLLNATDKFDTAGTIVGVLVLLAVLGAAGFGGYALYRRGRG